MSSPPPPAAPPVRFVDRGGRRPARLRRPAGRGPDRGLPGRLRVRHDGHQGAIPGELVRRPRPGLPPVRLSGPRAVLGAAGRRHDRRVAGRRARGPPGVRQGPGAPRRLQHGRLDHGAGGARGAGARPRARRRRRGARLHRGPPLGAARRGAARRPPAGRRRSTSRRATASLSPSRGAWWRTAGSRLVLRAPLSLPGPVRLLHGTRDPDVPWETSMRLADAIQSRDVALTLVKDGEPSPVGASRARAARRRRGEPPLTGDRGRFPAAGPPLHLRRAPPRRWVRAAPSRIASRRSAT